MPLKQCKKDFLELWGELAETGESDKRNTITVQEWKKQGKYYQENCPACRYAREKREALIKQEQKDFICDFCPIIWPGRSCSISRSPYSKWKEAVSDRSRKHWAAKVRDLPWKED